jgi:uncharacterized protein (TIGR00255 family)
MLSMTGFGAGSAEGPQGRVTAEARSVNARSLDVRCRLPEALGEASLWAEQLVRARLRRGRVELVVAADPTTSVAVHLDRPRALSAIRSLVELAREAGASEPPLSVLSALPGLFVPSATDLERLKSSAQRAAAIALEALEKDRAREGALIRTELAGRAETVARAVDLLRARTAELPAAFRTKMTERLQRSGVTLDPARLEAEVAILADRTDVSEELERLSAHTDHLRALIGGAGAEGRRLDFVLQEMLREATTLSAKAQDAATSREVVAIKVEIERMREQVQNVE